MMNPRTVGAASTAAVLAISLLACSNVSQSTSSGGNAGGVGRNASQPGVLRYAEIAEPDSLNPLVSTQATTADLSYFVYQYFFDVDDHDQLVPEAATDVPTFANGGISSDGMTLTYHMRRGLKWQDGVPLTASDVIFTFHAIMNPKNNVQVTTGYDHIGSITAPDDHTVVVHMKKFFAPIVAYFMCIQGNYPIMPAHLLAKYPDINHIAYNSTPVGSGPFRVTEWVHGDHVTMEANPLYWRGPPKLKKIVLKIVSDNNTIVTQLKTGETDAWFRADPSLYPSFSDIPGVSVVLSPQNVFGHLDFDLKDPGAPWQDVRVRQAIEYAIDRQAIVHDATHDVFQPTDSDQPFFSWAYDRKVPHIGFDPDKAKQLLAQAGWIPAADGTRVKAGQRLEIQYSDISGNPIGAAIGNIIQQELRAVGVDLTQKTYPAPLFFGAQQNGGIINSYKYQLAYFGWVSGVDPDDSSLYACDQYPPLGQNSLHWCDPKVDAAEKDALSTFDVARRKADYAIIQTELAEQVPSIILFSERRADVYTTNLKGFKASPATSAYWNSWEWSME
jgi:peptide/nickel transport system substrate-binding protein